ncbi:MAG: 2-C-methyl-D-erythritol 4-phosphate cytidylyltransferase [Sediminibacterium sp.]|nr:2-C-methyl-D-erythritol 4-phosphate cytidylyltransferase [Sediminibacterium sp.]
MIKKIGLIVAGGLGTRLNKTLPKQFLLIHNKPIIIYTIEKFIKAFEDIEFIIVLPKDYINYGTTLIKSFNFLQKIQFVAGGNTRFESVQNGLKNIHNDETIVFIHDAARCLVSSTLIQHCYNHCLKFNNAVPAIKSNNSIRMGDENSNKSILRTTIFIIQTPQTFYYKDLKDAYQQPFQENFTDDANVVENTGVKIHLINGEENNIKITNPIDLIIAAAMLK